jgi:signal transduction histidine kinase
MDNEMTIIILITAGIAACLCAAVIGAFRKRERDQMRKLNEILDQAIAGNPECADPDESEVSKIESKLLRFLRESGLKQEQMEEHRNSIHSLIGDISHQTKTPIANVKLYTQLLGEANPNEEQRRLIEQIESSADKLDFFIRSLVRSSRLESGVIKIAPYTGNVRTLIEEAAAPYRSEAEAKDIALFIEMPDEPLCAIYDPKWCAEAVGNIIDNAIKYTNRGGKIRIAASAYEMFVRIDLTDTGRGIAEENLPKVFARFWRGGDTAHMQGVGIGMYLARKIITDCGGYIRAVSEVGKGSTFSVFLSKP